eukprot:5126137-Pyramimonas_sp.AAC.1
MVMGRGLGGLAEDGHRLEFDPQLVSAVDAGEYSDVFGLAALDLHIEVNCPRNLVEYLLARALDEGPLLGE